MKIPQQSGNHLGKFSNHSATCIFHYLRPFGCEFPNSDPSGEKTALFFTDIGAAHGFVVRLSRPRLRYPPLKLRDFKHLKMDGVALNDSAPFWVFSGGEPLVSGR